MNYQTFIDSIEKKTAPRKLSSALLALWHDANGNWDKAHRLVQDGNSTDESWVHAYLHRKEGDLPNARYWYSQASKPPFTDSLEQEWESLVQSLLGD